MAFFPIAQNSTFGPNLIATSRVVQQAVDQVNLHVARITEMTDQQVATHYGTTLTQNQLLTTLTAVKTRLDDASIRDLTNKIG